VQTRFGVRLTCLKSSTNLPLKSNAFATDKFVDAFGNNIKKLVGAEGGGTTANHNSFMNAIYVVPPGPNPTQRGYERHPEDLQGHVQALRDRDLPEEDIRVLNKIIPDLPSTCGVRVRPLRT